MMNHYFKRPLYSSDIFLLCLISGAAIIKVLMAYTLPINQDEFHFLSYIYDFKRGALYHRFDTFHVHFFGWLEYLSINEVYQIIGARYILLFFYLGSCYLTYKIGRFFLNNTASLFSTLCFMGFSFVVVNGAGFRHDSIASFFYLASLHLILNKRTLTHAAIAGLCVGIALLFSIKSILYILTIIILFLLRAVLIDNFRINLKWIGIFIFSAVCFTAVLYYFHISSLSLPLQANITKAVGTNYEKTMNTAKLFPTWVFLITSFIQNPLTWLMMMLGILIVFIDLWKAKNFKNGIMLCFLIPLLTLAIYRNSYPYFYVFILSPAILFCGLVIQQVIESSDGPPKRSINLLICIIAFMVCYNAPYFYLKLFSSRPKLQSDTLAAVHRMFPSPVPYIDGCSMVSSFPSTMHFMSSLGMDRYIRQNTPIMEKRIKQRQPLFLIANVPHLDISLTFEEARSARGQRLLEKDWHTLKSNFIHHWGKIYVLGKTLELNTNSEVQYYRPLVSGKYSVESENQITINGVSYKNGDTVELETKNNTISSLNLPTEATLRWGEGLFIPTVPPPEGEIFLGPFM